MPVGETVWRDTAGDGVLAALEPGVPPDLDRRPDVLVVGGGARGRRRRRTAGDTDPGRTLTHSGARSSMDRASDYGSEGWGFESLQARTVLRQ